jgi:hypothetical protein
MEPALNLGRAETLFPMGSSIPTITLSLAYKKELAPYTWYLHGLIE